MAKRRRLSPPVFGMEVHEGVSEAEAFPADLETKSLFPAGAERGARPPIAQVAGEAAALAALEGIGAEMARARAEGRIVEAIDLAQIAADHLVRDRIALDEGEMAALEASLRARGQQMPIEVLDRGAQRVPRYGLISGWRRLSALRRIGAAQALAIVRTPASAADAYLAMVEENEIRADISFYERARIVQRALEEGVYGDPKAALQGLFGNVSRAKRSKIKSFMTIVTALGGVLRFPAALSEKAGLDLVARLEADPALAARLTARLAAADPASPEEERALLAADPLVPGADAAARLGPARAERTKPACTAQFDHETAEIRIIGPGVDAVLLRDLQRWLERR